MAVAPGTRIGVFEIVSTLGIGGMGEVYRAVDTRLKRDVAIKILPERFVSDPERLSRFRREAELLASLNHPHIAAVYGIEETAAGTALIMELVEGTDLRVRLARGTPSIEESLTIAGQLARAIGAAHERGIVHRDLKPGNIRVRDDGVVKVLDFGIAKALAGDGQRDDDTRTATERGSIMGTPRYMSPEQARGEVAGPQTDIWSFGVVFYEMLTGRAAFDAPNSTEVLSRVLNDTPDFTQLPAGLNPRIQLLVQRCLRKNVQQRLHHIGDAVIEIEEAAAPSIDSQPPRVSRWPIAVAAAAIVALVAVAGWSWMTRAAGPDARVVRTEISVPGGPLPVPMGARRVAVSRDGQRIAIATSGGLYIRRLDETELVKVSGAPLNPFFSPDGQQIGYFNTGETGSGLMIVPATGGTPKMLAPTAERSAGGDWRADGTIVFATASGIYLVRDDGAQLRMLAKPDQAARERILAFPQFLADGNAVLYTSTTIDTPPVARLARIDLETAKIDIILNGASAARYLPDGRLVFAARDRLRTVAFDPRHPSIAPDSAVDAGVAIVVARDNGAADFALSHQGDLLYMPPSNVVSSISHLFWVDRRGREEAIDLPLRSIAYPRLSPDGHRIVWDSINDGNRDVWLYDLRQRRLSQLTFGPTENNQPVWSRDGTRVFFASDRTGDFNIYSRAADGATDDRLEYAGPRIQFPNSVTPDGTGLFVLEDYIDIGLIRFPAPQRVEPVLKGKPSARLAELSPDGKWLAYESLENGPAQIFVRPYPDVNSRREQVSPAGGRYPIWNPSGNGELYFVSADGQMMAAKLLPSMAVGGITKLFDTAKPPAGLGGRPFDVSPVDGRFLMSRRETIGDTTQSRFSLVTKWGATLRPR